MVKLLSSFKSYQIIGFCMLEVKLQKRLRLELSLRLFFDDDGLQLWISFR